MVNIQHDKENSNWIKNKICQQTLLFVNVLTLFLRSDWTFLIYDTMLYWMLGWCYWIFIQFIIIDALLSSCLTNAEGQDSMLVDVVESCGRWSMISSLQSLVKSWYRLQSYIDNHSCWSLAYHQPSTSYIWTYREERIKCVTRIRND